MLEIVVCSLFVGSLGLQAVVLGNWMRWQHVGGNKDEEEEILTQYQAEENAHAEQQANGTGNQPKDPRLAGWEFKIVRAKRNLFRDQATLQRLCKEEAEAGWIMLEKLDDRRVRFKRPMALRDIVQPEFLAHDPYRCHYGSSWQPLTCLGAIAVLVAMILPAYLSYTWVSQTLTNSRSTRMPATFPPIEQSPSP